MTAVKWSMSGRSSPDERWLMYFRALTTFDVVWVCDVLRRVSDAPDGVDRRRSAEVDSRLAHNTQFVAAAKRVLNAS